MPAEATLPARERYVTDQNGNRVAVIINIEQYETMLDQLDELDAMRAYDEAKASGEEAIPFEQAIQEIEQNGS